VKIHSRGQNKHLDLIVPIVIFSVNADECLEQKHLCDEMPQAFVMNAIKITGIFPEVISGKDLISSGFFVKLRNLLRRDNGGF